MNREILFKAKRSDGGGWVQGDLLTKHPHHGYAILEHGCINYAINPDTICQYVGINDKNGNKIFEGDIVYIPLYGYTIIIFNDDICAFQYAYEAVGKGTAIGGRVANTLYNHDISKYEIKGNIHDKKQQP